MNAGTDWTSWFWLLVTVCAVMYGLAVSVTEFLRILEERKGPPKHTD